MVRHLIVVLWLALGGSVLAQEVSPRAQLREKKAALARDDHAGRLELARWALEQKLRPEAVELLLAVHAAGGESSVEAAAVLEKQLDYHLIDGTWRSPEEHYPAIGWVEVAGTWTAPEAAPLEDLRRAYAARVLELVNAERKKEKLRPLKPDERAGKAAEAHAEDMARRQFFAHETPEGTGPGPRIEKAGCKQYGWAENIAVAQKTPAEVVKSWMDSAPHRANILHPELTHLGVGLTRGKFRDQEAALYWVQVFLNKTKPKLKKQ